MTCHSGILGIRDEVEVGGQIVLVAAGPACPGGAGGYHGRGEVSLRATSQLRSQQLPLDNVLDIRYLHSTLLFTH